jgi:hypothetical protein
MANLDLVDVDDLLLQSRTWSAIEDEPVFTREHLMSWPDEARVAAQAELDAP